MTNSAAPRSNRHRAQLVPSRTVAVKVDPCLRTTYARRTACTRKRRGALAPHGHYAGRGSSRDEHVYSPNLSVADIASCLLEKTELRICPLKPNYCTSHVGNAQRVFLTVPCSSRFSLLMPIHLFSRSDPCVAARYCTPPSTLHTVHTSIDLLRIRVRL